MSISLIVERSSDNATKEFTPAEVKSGAVVSWVTDQQARADGWAVLVNQGGVGTPSVPTSDKPKIVKNGVLVEDFSQGILEFDGSDDGYTVDIVSRASVTAAVRADPQGSSRQTLIQADGLLVYTDGAGTIKARITNGTTTPIVSLSRHKGVMLVVAAADDSSLVLHVGGQTASTSHSIDRTQTGTVTVGKEDDGSNPMQGELSDAFAWPTFFTASQRTDLWQRRLSAYGKLLQPWTEEDLTNIERARVHSQDDFYPQMPVNWDFDLDFREGVVPQKVKDHHTRTSKATVLGADGNWKEVPAGEVAIHHDPVTGKRMGWFEKESTNLIDAGRDLSAGSWQQNNSPTLNTGKTGIDGQSAATEIVDDSSSREHMQHNVTVPKDNNGFTLCFFVKKQNATPVLRTIISFVGVGITEGLVLDPETGDHKEVSGDGAYKVISTPRWWWVLIAMNNDGNQDSVATYVDPAWNDTLTTSGDSSVTGSNIFDAFTAIRHGPAAEDSNGQAKEVYRAHPIFTGPPDYSVGTRTRAADEIDGMPVDWPTGVTSGGFFDVSQFGAGAFGSSDDNLHFSNSFVNLGPTDVGYRDGLTAHNKGIADIEEEGSLRISRNTDEDTPNGAPQDESIEALHVVPDRGYGEVKGASFGIRRIAAHPAPLTTSQKNHLEQKPKLLRNLEVFVDYENWTPGDPLPNRVRGTWADEFTDQNSVQASTSDPLFGTQSALYTKSNTEHHYVDRFIDLHNKDVYFAAWVKLNSKPSSGWDALMGNYGPNSGIMLYYDSSGNWSLVHRGVGGTLSVSAGSSALGERAFVEGWITRSNDTAHLRLNGGTESTSSSTRDFLRSEYQFAIGAQKQATNPFDGVVHNAVVEVADPSNGESLQWPSADAYNGGDGLTWNDVLNS